MKAYAVFLADVYWIAYAPDAAKAKGLVIQRAQSIWGGWLRQNMKTLRCRRWSALDRDWGGPELQAWGSPGDRDWETGSYIGTPEPFAARVLQAAGGGEA